MITENTVLEFLLPEHALPRLLNHFHCVCTCVCTYVSVCENLIQQLCIRIPSFSSAESLVSIWEFDNIWEAIYICPKLIGYVASQVEFVWVQSLCKCEALEVHNPRRKGAGGEPVTPGCFRGAQACKVLVLQCCCPSCEGWEDWYLQDQTLFSIYSDVSHLQNAILRCVFSRIFASGAHLEIAVSGWLFTKYV